MGATAPAAAACRAYEYFVPPHDMVTEPATHILSVDLSGSAAGYKKEHIRVQLVRNQGLVVVSGECPVDGDRWSRFWLEFRVPDGCDVKGIHAKFEDGVVRVTMPGLQSGPTVICAAKAGAAGTCVFRRDALALFPPERRKLVTTLVGVVLVLFSLGIFVRYSLAP